MQDVLCRVTHIIHNVLIFRHPDAAKRPSFMDITTQLQKSDFQILKWNEEEGEEEGKSLSEEAKILGRPLEAGGQLYKDLQNTYVYVNVN